MPARIRQLQPTLRAVFSRSPQRSLAALVLLLALAVSAGWSRADKQVVQQLEGTVVGVADGDTITVLDAEHQQYKIRFAFIDAPEKAQPFGQAAKKALSDKLYRQQVRVDVLERDKYGRNVGRVWLGEQDVNLGQVADGYAWHYQYYARKTQSRDEFQHYSAAEQQAREKRLGLWQDDSPTPPWSFRRARKSTAADVDGVPAAEPADVGR